MQQSMASRSFLCRFPHTEQMYQVPVLSEIHSDAMNGSSSFGLLAVFVCFIFFPFLCRILNVNGVFQITNFAAFRPFEDVWCLLVFC